VTSRLQRLVGAALIDRVPRDHQQTDRAVRRRRIVVAGALVAGSALLGLSLATRPGDAHFYPLLLGVAAVWVVGGVLSGPLHLGYLPFRGELRRPLLTPVAIGVAAGAVFLAGGSVVRLISPLRTYVAHVLDHAQQGNLALVALLALANGIGEEIFFRGALFAAVGRRFPVRASTAVYVLVTVATRNPMLVFAAAVMGALFGLQRRASGGILAPMLTHLTWSMIMLFALPPVIGT
jgi:uncharacterized protein